MYMRKQLILFSNPDIKNVAISGPYSAGKSRVLESYKAKHTDHSFVHLSLAHFRTPEQESTEPESSVKESILEGKILNQLIHQIPSEKIPQTNFRWRLHGLSTDSSPNSHTTDVYRSDKGIRGLGITSGNTSSTFQG